MGRREPGEPPRGLPFICPGLIILNDVQTCAPYAVMDCTWITGYRTGAATAVAAKHLARRDSATAGIIACGFQGRTNLLALAEVLPLTRAYAFDTDDRVQRRFVSEMSAALNIEIIGVRDVREAVIASDLVVTSGPILPGALAQCDRIATDDHAQFRYYRELRLLRHDPRALRRSRRARDRPQAGSSVARRAHAGRTWAWPSTTWPWRLRCTAAHAIAGSAPGWRNSGACPRPWVRSRVGPEEAPMPAPSPAPDDELYRALQQHLDRMPVPYPATESGVELSILRRLFSPEDARLALCLGVIPETLVTIHQRAGRKTPRAALAAALDGMAQRGIIQRVATKRGALHGKAPFVVGFYEAQVNRLTADLQRDVERYEEEAFGAAYSAQSPNCGPSPSTSPSVSSASSSATTTFGRSCVPRRGRSR